MLRQSFKNSRGAHATAHAHRYHSVPPVPTFQLAQDAGGQLRTGATQRMAQGNCTAVYIHLINVEAQCLDDGQRLRGEGFV